MQLPSPGDQFQEKYLIRNSLGEGGFATVFRATDVEIQRDVAIKVLAPQDGQYPPGVVARFMVEARVIAGLQDPHTIRLFEFGESSDGLLYMVFQYVAGVDLASLLRDRGALPPETAVHITMQVLGALAEAHAAGVLHRDIKPANILIHEYMGDAFAAKLLDFGIAKADSATGGAGLTKTGARLGTPRYMAPEQVFGEPVSPRSDLYSLGLVIFEMLVGRPAIEGDQKQILHHQLSEAPLHLPEHAAWPTLRAVVDRMIARDLAHRYGTAGEVAHALATALSDRRAAASSSGVAPIPVVGPRQRPQPVSQPPPVSDPPPVSEPTITSKPGNRWVPFASLLLCSVVASAAFVMSRANEAPPSRPTELPSALLTSKPGPVSRPAPVEAPAEQVALDAGSDALDADEVPVVDGCGHTQQHTAGWIDLGFRQRQARAFLPANYDPSRRYPVIVALAPRYLSVPGYINDTQFTKLILKQDAIVIAPAPDNRLDPWEDRFDVETIRRAIRSAGEQFCVDRTKVFATGHHDGARMLRQAACEIPFSAIVLTGFGEKVHIEGCELDPAIPVMWVIGRDDEFLPLSGGQGCTSGPYLSAADHDSMWKRRNKCRGGATVWRKKKTSECTTWTCEAAPYVSCRADGGHHLGPSDWTLLYPMCRNNVLEFDLHKAAWEFFQEHGRALSPAEQQEHRLW